MELVIPDNSTQLESYPLLISIISNNFREIIKVKNYKKDYIFPEWIFSWSARITWFSFLGQVLRTIKPYQHQNTKALTKKNNLQMQSQIFHPYYISLNQQLPNLPTLGSSAKITERLENDKHIFPVISKRADHSGL